MTEAERYDLLVIGGGPAGLAAGAVAADAGLDVGIVDERPTFGGQIYKQFGAGFRVRDAAALGRDYRRGRELIEAAERSGARLLPSTSAVSIVDDVVHARRGRRARTLGRRASDPAGAGGARPARGLPRLDAARRDHGRRRPGARQDAAHRARRPDRVRRQRPARARVPGAAPPLRRERRARARGRSRPRAPRPAAARRGRPRQHGAAARCRRLPLGAAARPHAAALPAHRGAGRGSTTASRSSSTPPSTPTGGSFPAPRSASTPMSCASATGSSRRSSSCGWPAASSGTTRTPAARSSYATSGCAPPRRASRPRETGPASRARTSRSPRGASPRSASRVDLGKLSVDEVATRAGPIRDVLRRKQAFGEALRGLHAIGPGIYELATDETVVCRCEEVTRAQLDRAVDGERRHQRGEGTHARRHGPVPGAELPARDRRDDRAAPRTSATVGLVLDSAISRPARADRRAGRGGRGRRLLHE